ncbi:hypothetical protein [Streptomyces sp. st115]|uniref:hypothetical protein n=1 Tax=Streptomyces sp. st115 TaxID=1828047 RepID=UPI000BF1DA4C|nr:hypothetical protein [Streptomyces sp. st115]
MTARPLAAYVAAYIAAIRDYRRHLAHCRRCTRTVHCHRGSRRHTDYLRTQAAYRAARDHRR